LAAAGVVKGARVAVLMANRPEWVVASFAIGLVGGVLVPVNTFATPIERDYILRHSDASLLLAQPTLLKRDFVAELVEGHPELADCEPGALRCPALPHLRGVAVLGPDGARGGIQSWQQLLARGETVSEELLDAMADEVVPSDDGVLIYTSGTTAHPKGVLHMQRAPVIQSWRFAETMQLTEDDVVFTAQPFFWTAGMAMSLGATLAAGARLVLQQTFEPGAALELIEAERATAVHAWPHQEKALAEHPSASQRDLSRVRKVEFSSPLAALVGLEKDEWGTYGSYGLSETFTLAAALPASAPAELRRKTSGLPLPGISLRIVDPETGNLLADPRGKGEIALKGVTLMRGYYKVAPELCLDAEGYFHTQDGGSFDADGYLHWTGRLSNLIKTGGANVSPLEIERALDADPEIRVALAVGVPHPVLGEVIALCVVCADGEQPTPDRARAKEQVLREQLRSKLAAYKVPKRVLFFRASELAYTANQKIQVGPLQQAALARLQRERAEIDGVLYQAPEDSTDPEGSA
jgi:acyl-CoA synthetase (AMP-forming)/AMP-acid ligase II